MLALALLTNAIGGSRSPLLPVPLGLERVTMTTLSRPLQAKQALFSSYDQLNERINKVEERLTSFHVSQGVSYEYERVTSPNPQEGWTSFVLEIAKIKGKWRICHVEYWSEAPDQRPHPKPLVECSARDRVRAAKHLAKLEELIVKDSEQFLSDVDAAVAEIDKYLESAS